MGTTNSSGYFEVDSDAETVKWGSHSDTGEAHSHLQFSTGPSHGKRDDDPMPDYKTDESDKIAKWAGMHTLYRSLYNRLSTLFKGLRGDSPPPAVLKEAVAKVTSDLKDPRFSQWFEPRSGSQEQTFKEGIVQSIWELDGHSTRPRSADSQKEQQRVADLIWGLVKLKSLRAGERKTNALVVAKATDKFLQLVNRLYVSKDTKYQFEVSTALLKLTAIEQLNLQPELLAFEFVGQSGRIRNPPQSNLILMASEDGFTIDRTSILTGPIVTPEDMLRDGYIEGFTLKKGAVYFMDGGFSNGTYEYEVRSMDSKSATPWIYALFTSPNSVDSSEMPVSEIVKPDEKMAAASSTVAALSGVAVLSAAAGTNPSASAAAAAAPVTKPAANPSPPKKPAEKRKASAPPKLLGDSSTMQIPYVATPAVLKGRQSLYSELPSAYRNSFTFTPLDPKTEIAQWAISELPVGWKSEKNAPSYTFYDEKEKTNKALDYDVKSWKSLLSRVQDRLVIGRIRYRPDHIAPILPSVVLGHVYASADSASTKYETVAKSIAAHAVIRLGLLESFYKVKPDSKVESDVLVDKAGFLSEFKPHGSDLREELYGHLYYHEWDRRQMYKSKSPITDAGHPFVIKHEYAYTVNPFDADQKEYSGRVLIRAPSTYINSANPPMTRLRLLLIQIYGSAIYEIAAYMRGIKTDSGRMVALNAFLMGLPRRLLLVPYSDKPSKTLQFTTTTAEPSKDPEKRYQQLITEVSNMHGDKVGMPYAEQLMKLGEPKSSAERKQSELLKLKELALKLDDVLRDQITRQMRQLKDIAEHYNATVDRKEAKKGGSAAEAAAAAAETAVVPASTDDAAERTESDTESSPKKRKPESVAAPPSKAPVSSPAPSPAAAAAVVLASAVSAAAAEAPVEATSIPPSRRKIRIREDEEETPSAPAASAAAPAPSRRQIRPEKEEEPAAVIPSRRQIRPEKSDEPEPKVKLEPTGPKRQRDPEAEKKPRDPSTEVIVLSDEEEPAVPKKVKLELLSFGYAPVQLKAGDRDGLRRFTQLINELSLEVVKEDGGEPTLLQAKYIETQSKADHMKDGYWRFNRKGEFEANLPYNSAASKPSDNSGFSSGWATTPENEFKITTYAENNVLVFILDASLEESKKPAVKSLISKTVKAIFGVDVVYDRLVPLILLPGPGRGAAASSSASEAPARIAPASKAVPPAAKHTNILSVPAAAAAAAAAAPPSPARPPPPPPAAAAVSAVGAGIARPPPVLPAAGPPEPVIEPVYKSDKQEKTAMDIRPSAPPSAKYSSAAAAAAPARDPLASVDRDVQLAILRDIELKKSSKGTAPMKVDEPPAASSSSAAAAASAKPKPVPASPTKPPPVPVDTKAIDEEVERTMKEFDALNIDDVKKFDRYLPYVAASLSEEDPKKFIEKLKEEYRKVVHRQNEQRRIQYETPSPAKPKQKAAPAAAASESSPAKSKARPKPVEKERKRDPVLEEKLAKIAADKAAAAASKPVAAKADKKSSEKKAPKPTKGRRSENEEEEDSEWEDLKDAVMHPDSETSELIETTKYPPRRWVLLLEMVADRDAVHQKGVSMELLAQVITSLYKKLPVGYELELTDAQRKALNSPLMMEGKRSLF